MNHMAKKTRSGASCVWHSIWCVIATLLLTGGIALNLAARSYIKEDALAKTIGSMNIAAVTIGDKTVAEEIRDEYVADDKVKLSDIETAIHGMGIEAFAEDKLTAMGKLLRGETDEPVHITADEIIELLEKSEYDLYTQCLLIIEDSDKEEIRNVAEGPLNVFNKTMTFLFGSPAMRAVSRYFVSTACVVVNVILLALLLCRWMIVRAQADKTRSGACTGMGITILVPAALTLIGAVVYSISNAFTPDGAETLYTVGKVLVHPFWSIALLGIFSGVLLILAAAIMRRVAQRKLDAALAGNNTPVESTRMEAVENVAKPDPFIAPMPAKAETPVATTHCIACARTLAQGSKFCIYCGTPQTPPAEPDVPAAEAAAETAPAPAAVPAENITSAIAPAEEAAPVEETPADSVIG